MGHPLLPLPAHVAVTHVYPLPTFPLKVSSLARARSLFNLKGVENNRGAAKLMCRHLANLWVAFLNYLGHRGHLSSKSCHACTLD